MSEETLRTTEADEGRAAESVDRDAQVGFGQDVGNASAPVPEHATVVERRPVLVSGRQAHRGTVDGHDPRWP